MKIVAYPNCSKGGVSTVIRNRALTEPQTQFLALFCSDRGGRGAFADLDNVRVEILEKPRMAGYIRYLLRHFEVEQVSILNLPEVANGVAADAGDRLVFEFHSSDVPWIEREIAQLDLGLVGRLAVPSEQMLDVLSADLDPDVAALLDVIPNDLGPDVFTPEGEKASFDGVFGAASRILVWVGRLEWKKGDVDFLRVLSLLPDDYVGVMIISLEDNPDPVSAILREALELGVENRLHLLMDLNQRQVASVFRAARDAGGWFVSTSYIESYGYAVREALGCGLRVAAYEPEIPVWADLYERSDAEFGPLGDPSGLAIKIEKGTPL